MRTSLRLHMIRTVRLQIWLLISWSNGHILYPESSHRLSLYCIKNCRRRNIHSRPSAVTSDTSTSEISFFLYREERGKHASLTGLGLIIRRIRMISLWIFVVPWRCWRLAYALRHFPTLLLHATALTTHSNNNKFLFFWGEIIGKPNIYIYIFLTRWSINPTVKIHATATHEKKSLR